MYRLFSVTKLEGRQNCISHLPSILLWLLSICHTSTWGQGSAHLCRCNVADVFRCKLLQKSGLASIIQTQEKDSHLLVWCTFQFAQNWEQALKQPWRREITFGALTLILVDIRISSPPWKKFLVVECSQYYFPVQCHLFHLLPPSKFWQKYFSKFSNSINSMTYSCSSY